MRWDHKCVHIVNKNITARIVKGMPIVFMTNTKDYVRIAMEVVYVYTKLQNLSVDNVVLAHIVHIINARKAVKNAMALLCVHMV